MREMSRYLSRFAQPKYKYCGLHIKYEMKFPHLSRFHSIRRRAELFHRRHFIVYCNSREKRENERTSLLRFADERGNSRNKRHFSRRRRRWQDIVEETNHTKQASYLSFVRLQRSSSLIILKQFILRVENVNRKCEKIKYIYLPRESENPRIKALLVPPCVVRPSF